ISTLKVEELVQELKEKYSIIIVTHNMQQAARVSDKTAFFLNGYVNEYDDTDKISLILLINKLKIISLDASGNQYMAIRQKYEGQLKALIKDLRRLGLRVYYNIEYGLKSLSEEDRNYARQTIANDKNINALETDINEKVI